MLPQQEKDGARTRMVITTTFRKCPTVPWGPKHDPAQAQTPPSPWTAHGYPTVWAQQSQNPGHAMDTTPVSPGVTPWTSPSVTRVHAMDPTPVSPRVTPRTPARHPWGHTQPPAPCPQGHMSSGTLSPCHPQTSLDMPHPIPKP